MIGWSYLKLKHPKFWLKFEFDQNADSGMGSWGQLINPDCVDILLSLCALLATKMSLLQMNLPGTETGIFLENYPDSKVPGANMGPIWGLQDPGGPHVGPMNFAIWVGQGFTLGI